MSPITIEMVSRSYNGKSGCMCGCNGNYSLPSHVVIEAANLSLGYEGYDDTDVSDRRVKIAISKVNKALAYHSHELDDDGEYNGDGVSVGRNDDFAWIDQGGRNTVVYF